jgi:hypothetical protein
VGHLAVWLSAVLPVLDHFVSAAEGHPDLYFWGSVCNIAGSYGQPEDPLTGWLSVFFPYLQSGTNGKCMNQAVGAWTDCYAVAKQFGVEAALQRAQEVAWEEEDDGEVETVEKPGEEKVEWSYGVDVSQFPSGISSAPVLAHWFDAGIEQDLVFYGGLFAVHQHPDGAMEARTGWAVIEPRNSKKKPWKPPAPFAPIPNPREATPPKKPTIRIPKVTQQVPRRRPLR